MDPRRPSRPTSIGYAIVTLFLGGPTGPILFGPDWIWPIPQSGWPGWRTRMPGSSRLGTSLPLQDKPCNASLTPTG